MMVGRLFAPPTTSGSMGQRLRMSTSKLGRERRVVRGMYLRSHLNLSEYMATFLRWRRGAYMIVGIFMDSFMEMDTRH
jgi:hypothetical protein